MALYDPKPASAAEMLLATLEQPAAAEACAARFPAYRAVTGANVQNLVKLASHLRSLPTGYEGFNMSYYSARWEDGEVTGLEPSEAECGTVACAVGHGPAAGVAARPREGWTQYQYRAFGNLHAALFAADWTGTDNTPHGAAARICWLLNSPELADDLRSECCPSLYEDWLA